MQVPTGSPKQYSPGSLAVSMTSRPKLGTSCCCILGIGKGLPLKLRRVHNFQHSVSSESSSQGPNAPFKNPTSNASPEFHAIPHAGS